MWNSRLRRGPWRNGHALDLLRLQRRRRGQIPPRGRGIHRPGNTPNRRGFLHNRGGKFHRTQRIRHLEHPDGRIREAPHGQGVRAGLRLEKQLVVRGPQAPGIADIQAVNQHGRRGHAGLAPHFDGNGNRGAGQVRRGAGLRQARIARPLAVVQQLSGRGQARVVVQGRSALVAAHQAGGHGALPDIGMQVGQRHIGCPGPGGRGRGQALAGPDKVVVIRSARSKGHEIEILLGDRRIPEPGIRGHIRRGAVGGAHGQAGPRLKEVHIAVRIRVAIGLSEEQQRRPGGFGPPGHGGSAAGQRQVGLGHRLCRLGLAVPGESSRNLRRGQPVKSVARDGDPQPGPGSDRREIARLADRPARNLGRHRSRRRKFGFHGQRDEFTRPFAQFRIDRHQPAGNFIADARSRSGIADPIYPARGIE